MTARLERVERLIARGIEEGLHTGAQVYVSLGGRVMVDQGFGTDPSGKELGGATVMPWLSSGKPVTAVAVAQLWEAGDVRLEDRVARFVPEFAAAGKQEITVEQLLTHTAGLRTADRLARTLPWGEAVAGICRAEREPEWIPGRRAGYHVSGTWLLLGEVVQRVTGRRFEQHLRDEILDPLGMSATRAARPCVEGSAGDAATGFVAPSGSMKGSLADSLLEARPGECRPGSSLWGPMRDLGGFYEALLAWSGGGGAGRRPLLRESTVRVWTERRRCGMFDETFRHVLDFGCGFLLDSSRYGRETVPYGYGGHCSEGTFGHSGAQCSCGFADPAHGLVVAWVFTGQPGETRHQARAREMNSVIYEQLELAPTLALERGGAAMT